MTAPHPIPDYKPDHFIGVANQDKDLTKVLWTFFNSAEIVTRLMMAAEMKQPAIVAVEKPLRILFTDDLYLEIMNHDGTKRMVGHMLRQVMENVGFEIEKKQAKAKDVRDDDEKARLTALFSVGARYRENRLLANEAALTTYARAAKNPEMVEEIRRAAQAAREKRAAEQAPNKSKPEDL